MGWAAGWVSNVAGLRNRKQNGNGLMVKGQ